MVRDFKREQSGDVRDVEDELAPRVVIVIAK
jgi:hypothetical protein